MDPREFGPFGGVWRGSSGGLEGGKPGLEGVKAGSKPMPTNAKGRRGPCKGSHRRSALPGAGGDNRAGVGHSRADDAPAWGQSSESASGPVIISPAT